jgi:VWFA-related protein
MRFGVLVGVAILTAQQTSAPQPTFRTSVDVVQVDVSVLDKDRKPVRGLTASDFTILEDGKPRPAVAFVPVDLAEPETTPTAAPWVRDVASDVATNRVRPEGRLMVIMFDWSIRVEDQILAQRIARAAVDQLGPDDLAAVVFSSAFGNAGAPQNFTADRARLLAAINQPFAVALRNPPNGPGHDPRNGNGVMIDDPEGYESGDCHCRVCVPETIGRIADAVRDVQGRRKTLLFIGTYFRMQESLRGPQSRQGPQFTPGLNGKQVIYPGECSAQVQIAREKMERATSLANLTIHTLDAVGVETDMNSPLGGSWTGIRERQDDVRALAEMTGGRTVMNTSAPEDHVRELFAESHSYYLVAFAPGDREPNGKYHKIEVKVNRPGVSVRTRSGYYAGETRVAGNKPSVVAPETVTALEGVLPRSDVPLTLSVAPFGVAGKSESDVAIVLGARQTIPIEPRGASTPVRVLAAAFDRNGRSVNSEHQTVGITLPTNAAGDFPYEVLSRLALKPGRYELRVAVDAPPGQSASVYTYVDVPDFSSTPLSLSGLVLSASPPWPIAPPEGFKDLLPVVPTTRRDFDRGDRVSAFVRVYQGSKDAPRSAELLAQILDVSGRVVTKDAYSIESGRFAATRSADYRIAVPVDRLSHGEYLLTVDATQATHTARRGVRFRVR